MIVRIRDVRPPAFRDEREALKWEVLSQRAFEARPYKKSESAPVVYLIFSALAGLALIGWTVFTLVGEWINW